MKDIIQYDNYKIRNFKKNIDKCPACGLMGKKVVYHDDHTMYIHEKRRFYGGYQITRSCKVNS